MPKAWVNIRLDEMAKEEVLITVNVAHARRFVGLFSIYALAVLLVYLGVQHDGALLTQCVLVALGLAAGVGGFYMAQATKNGLELTHDELRETSGRILAKVDDIARVDRGAFAMKPSNGFSVFLKHDHPRVWRLGLWWRYGTRLGVGGIINVGQGKAMAEKLTDLVAERS